MHVYHMYMCIRKTFEYSFVDKGNVAVEKSDLSSHDKSPLKRQRTSVPFTFINSIFFADI